MHTPFPLQTILKRIFFHAVIYFLLLPQNQTPYKEKNNSYKSETLIEALKKVNKKDKQKDTTPSN